MRAWRIVETTDALDRECEDVRRMGGRWNPVGLPLLYAGATVELAVLEALAHREDGDCELSLVKVELPDEAGIRILSPEDLPGGWDVVPHGPSTQAIGRAWLESRTSLVLQVPSVLAAEGWNVLVNPLHPRYDDVEFEIVRSFCFDRRLFKESRQTGG